MQSLKWNAGFPSAGNENLAQLEKECGGSVFDVTIHCEMSRRLTKLWRCSTLQTGCTGVKRQRIRPTEKDAVHGNVLVKYMDATFAQSATWDIVAGAPDTFPLWMPMPELPEEKRS